MALIDCPKCKKAYSNIKEACPFCGHNPKEEALRQEIIKQTAQVQSVQESHQAMPQCKNQAIAAALAFFFWWIAADVFYTRGFLAGVVYLLLVPLIVVFCCSALIYTQNVLIILLLSIIVIFLISVIKALYYLAMTADNFQRKYR